jgi:putative transposase
MIDPEYHLSIKRQSELIGIARSTAYYKPVPVSNGDLELMRIIDEIHLESPFAGSRMIRDMLRLEGYEIGRRHVRTLMHRMGIHAIYRKPKTSQPHPEHRVYPYLLRDLSITEANHVWAADISYIPMRRGFLYLFAIIDWATRRILSWRLSNSLSTDFCVDAVEEAVIKHGCPAIFNTDQGAQFTGDDFTEVLKFHKIAISMDGKGCWRDNVFIERFWRSIKYEEVYLHAYESVQEARAGISRYIDFYNSRRPHTALDGRTPNAVYFKEAALLAA